MVRVPIPLVVDADCFFSGRVEAVASLRVGSCAWYHWLSGEQGEQPRSFAFRSQQRSFTARREQQRSGWYWYAYRKLHGKTYKTYLGKSEELTLDLLQQAAAALASRVSAPLPANVPPEAAARRTGPLPCLPTTSIARPHLLARLDKGRQGPVTVICAPAGWGKTTLLAEWGRQLVQQGVPVTWLTMDADPARFWLHLTHSLHPLQTGSAEAALDPLDFVATALVRQVRVHNTPLVLIVDECQRLPLVYQQALARLIEALPPRVHLVLAGRDEPPFALSLLRSRCLALELGVADLAFNEREASTLLTERLALPVSRKTCARLVACTAGWAAGLHLAALAAQSAPDAEEVIARLFFGREQVQSCEEVAAPLEPVTERERDVLSLLIEGASNREIAQQLIISEGTVKKHVSNICSKLGVRRRSQVIHRALALR